MTDSTQTVSSNRSVFGYILLHLLPHGSVGISVPIPVAAAQLVTAVSFTACCTAVRYQYVSYASPVVVYKKLKNVSCEYDRLNG